MTELRATDMTVLNFLEHLPATYRNDMSIMMYDTEPTVFAMGLHNRVPFDVGYRSFTLTGGKGKPGGGLVYEVIRDREMMGHLSQQGKIKYAMAGELYHVLTLLRDEVDPGTGRKGWFSDKVDEIPLYGVKTREQLVGLMEDDVDRLIFEHELSGVVGSDGRDTRDVYQKMSAILKVNREAVDHFKSQKEQNNVSRLKQQNAIRREMEMTALLNTYSEYLRRESSNRETITSLKDKNEKMHEKIVHLRKLNLKMNYKKLRLGQDLDMALDMVQLKSLPGGENIKPAKEIFSEYEKAFDGCVGVMGHNVASDLQWTRTLMDAIDGMERYKYLFDPKKITAFCSMQLMSRLYSLEGTDLLQTMLSANADQLAGLFSDSANNLPALVQKGMSLECLCEAIIDMDGPQKHTAVTDVDLTIELFQKVAEEFVRGNLAERRELGGK